MNEQMYNEFMELLTRATIVCKSYEKSAVKNRDLFSAVMSDIIESHIKAIEDVVETTHFIYKEVHR